VPECSGEGIKGDRIQRRAAAVNREICRLLVSKIINRLHNRQLRRMIRIAVGRDVSVLQNSGSDHPGVLSRAVHCKRRLRHAHANGVLPGLLVKRPFSRHLQR
jgi:hypothetical protein